jgi:hypothetical protein
MISFNTKIEMPDLDKKIAQISPSLKQTVKYHAGEIKSNAQKHLAPIYKDRKKWHVSGDLRRLIGIDYLEGESMAVIYNPVPYARIRHYVNYAHPSTVGYFSIPLFKQRKPFKKDIKMVYKKFLGTI